MLDGDTYTISQEYDQRRGYMPDRIYRVYEGRGDDGEPVLELWTPELEWADEGRGSAGSEVRAFVGHAASGEAGRNADRMDPTGATGRTAPDEIAGVGETAPSTLELVGARSGEVGEVPDLDYEVHSRQERHLLVSRRGDEPVVFSEVSVDGGRVTDSWAVTTESGPDCSLTETGLRRYPKTVIGTVEWSVLNFLFGPDSSDRSLDAKPISRTIPLSIVVEDGPEQVGTIQGQWRLTDEMVVDVGPRLDAESVVLAMVAIDAIENK